MSQPRRPECWYRAQNEYLPFDRLRERGALLSRNDFDKIWRTQYNRFVRPYVGTDVLYNDPWFEYLTDKWMWHKVGLHKAPPNPTPCWPCAMEFPGRLYLETSPEIVARQYSASGEPVDISDTSSSDISAGVSQPSETSTTIDAPTMTDPMPSASISMAPAIVDIPAQHHDGSVGSIDTSGNIDVEETSTTKNCLICHAEYSDYQSQITLFGCNHRFHKGCLAEWVNFCADEGSAENSFEYKCPYCRQTYEDVTYTRHMNLHSHDNGIWGDVISAANMLDPIFSTSSTLAAEYLLELGFVVRRAEPGEDGLCPRCGETFHEGACDSNSEDTDSEDSNSGSPGDDNSNEVEPSEASGTDPLYDLCTACDLRHRPNTCTVRDSEDSNSTSESSNLCDSCVGNWVSFLQADTSQAEIKRLSVDLARVHSALYRVGQQLSEEKLKSQPKSDASTPSSADLKPWETIPQAKIDISKVVPRRPR